MSLPEYIASHIEALNLDVTTSTLMIQNPDESELEKLYVAILPTSRVVNPFTRECSQEELTVSLLCTKLVENEDEVAPLLETVKDIADSFLRATIGDYRVIKVTHATLADYSLLAEKNLFQSEIQIELHTILQK